MLSRIWIKKLGKNRNYRKSCKNENKEWNGTLNRIRYYKWEQKLNKENEKVKLKK